MDFLRCSWSGCGDRRIGVKYCRWHSPYEKEIPCHSCGDMDLPPQANDTIPMTALDTKGNLWCFMCSRRCMHDGCEIRLPIIQRFCDTHKEDEKKLPPEPKLHCFDCKKEIVGGKRASRIVNFVPRDPKVKRDATNSGVSHTKCYDAKRN